MDIALIAAMGEANELGANNELLWHLPDDFAWFVKHTKGKPVVMGRKTMESLGRPLKNRLNIVLSRSAVTVEGFVGARSWEEAFSLAKHWLEEKLALASDAEGVVLESEIVAADNSSELAGNTAKNLDENGDWIARKNEIMVIGGGEIYKQAMDFANRLYITQVNACFTDADTHFPTIGNTWKPVFGKSHEKDEKHSYSFEFQVFEKNL